MNFIKKVSFIVVLIFSIYGISGCGPTTYVTAGVEYSNPIWAPPYYSGVRYYYLPDIETYYDLSDQEFVYLDNGQWLFSPALPPIYSSYDLNNGFVVALNVGVYRPWLHHQYYVAHYPRYYYHNVYLDNIAAIRGFNENQRKPFYWKEEDRNRINNPRTNQKPQPKVEKKVEAPKPPQKPNYYGKKIGKPVKVKPQMKEKKPGKKGHGNP